MWHSGGKMMAAVVNWMITKCLQVGEVSRESNVTSGPERSARLFCRRRSTVVPNFGTLCPEVAP